MTFDPQLVSLFWTAYIIVSTIVGMELWYTLSIVQKKTEQQDIVIRTLESNVAVRLDEIEHQLTTVGKINTSKFHQLYNLYNASITSRTEHANQLTKHRILIENCENEAQKRKTLEEHVYREFRNVYQTTLFLDPHSQVQQELVSENLHGLNRRFYNRDDDYDLLDINVE